MKKSLPEIRVDMTGWSAGDWPLMRAVKVETNSDDHLIRIFFDEDEAEKVAAEMIQHHFEMLCGLEQGDDEAGFTIRAEGLEFTASVLSRPIIVPWDKIGCWPQKGPAPKIAVHDDAAIAALEKWLKAQRN